MSYQKGGCGAKADVSSALVTQALLTRVVQRPQSSVDALKRACSEVGTGVVSGVTGVLVDPLQVISVFH